MSKKFLFVNTNGFYEETAGAYEQADFINTSAGVADAGKPIVLDAAGEIDASMINFGAIDHGSLSGLDGDDHTQYSLVDGTRAYTGIVSYSSHPSFSTDTQIVDKKYVDDVVAGIEWQDSVISRIATPPGSPSTGDRHLVIATATGAWVGQEDNIAEWNGASWVFTSPTTGMHVAVDNEADVIYLYTGSAWTSKSYEVTTASNGLTKVGVDIQVDPTLAGDGLAFSTGVMSVNVDDSSIEIATDTLQVKALGITDAMLAGSISDGKLAEDYIKTSESDDSSLEWTGTQLQVKADGINDTHIDFGTGLNQVSAADVPVADAGGYTTQTDLEGVTQELYDLVANRGNIYTVGTGGVTKGDLLFVSGNDEVETYASTGNADYCVGLALTTESAAASVRVLANDVVLDGVLTGATAGDVYYWDGSSIVASIPTGSGAYVYQVGVAKNATDLHIEVKLVKRNSV